MASPGLAAGLLPAEEDYKRFLLSRVRSIGTDPLHSAAYLHNLAHFLRRPSQEIGRNSPILGNWQTAPTAPVRPFVHEYQLSVTAPPQLTIFHDVNKYRQSRPNGVQNEDGNELVMMTGRPSADWLGAIGARYQLDHRFFHQHLDLTSTGQKPWYTAPTLPSRSHDVLRLCVPSILFLGDRHVKLDSLRKARTEYNRQLRSIFRSVRDGMPADSGRSIVRRINIHSGDSLVIEQELSATLIRRSSHWTVLIWTDASQDIGCDLLLTPATHQFLEGLERVNFCPVFFEKDLTVDPRSAEKPAPNPPLKQPFAFLPTNYGCTMDWTKASTDPFAAIEELLTFYTSSEAQYIHVLEHFVEQEIAYAESTQTDPNVSSILHFDYVKSILIRHDASITGLRQSLDKGFRQWKLGDNHESEEGMLKATLLPDLDYLSTRAQKAITLCEAGKSTIMSNKSIEENRQAKEQARLVTELTKVTNRLTFIFLPISFVTSAFGMNFVQFGQGHLSIWLWVEITLPLLAACILLVERGSDVKALCVKFAKALMQNG